MTTQTSKEIITVQILLNIYIYIYTIHILHILQYIYYKHI